MGAGLLVCSQPKLQAERVHKGQLKAHFANQTYAQ
jgi:hypothetical protein